MGAGGELLLPAELSARPWVGDGRDIEAVLTAALDPEIQRYSSVGQVGSRADAEAWLLARKSPDRLEWVIERHGVIAGRLSLAHINDEDGEAEIGYWLLPAARGIGVATTGVRALCEWGFGHRQLSRLVIRHEPENVRSCLVAERCGFLEEGLQRGALARGATRYDLHMHARLATDPALP